MTLDPSPGKLWNQAADEYPDDEAWTVDFPASRFRVAARRALAVECKVGRNKPTQAQLDWLAALGHVPGIEAHVWSPADWDQIVEAVR